MSTATSRPSIYAEQPPEVKALIAAMSSADPAAADAATREFARSAIEEPLRKGILAGNVIDGIYAPLPLGPTESPEYPLDPLSPGVEKEHVAYTIPGQGRLPERTIEADFVMIPTYEVGSSIDWPLRLALKAPWIVNRATEIFEAGFTKKNNDDGWHTLLYAGVNRNIVVYDANAGAGRLTLRLITLMDQAMRRNAGGNTTSISRGKMTDLYMSIEMLADMRNWTLADVTQAVRDQVFTSVEGHVNRLFDVNLHELIEFGVGQEYQNYFLNDLGGSLAAGDVELLVGLDLQRNDSFINPIRQQIEVFPDTTMHRQRRAGVYGWSDHGFAAMDNRRIILASA